MQSSCPSPIFEESLLIPAIDKLEDDIYEAPEWAITGFTSLCADSDIDQDVGQSSGEILLRICLLYTDNVDNSDT